MPFRLVPGVSGKLQFRTAASHPYLTRKAAQISHNGNMTAYLQDALCEKLSRDLGLDLETLRAELPPTRNLSGYDRQVH